MASMGRRITTAGLFALALGGTGANPADGQAALLGAGGGYVGMGASGVAIGELNDRLAAGGYPTFGRRATTVSLGLYRTLVSGAMLGAEWNGLILGENLHEGNEVGLGGGYATLGVGYQMEISPRMRAHPRIGVGPGGFGLWVEDDEGEVGFDEVLADPDAAPEQASEAVLSRAGLVIDLGAGVEHRPAGEDRGLLIGLRFGYLAAPSSTEWTIREHEVTGAPAASIAGPYLRVMVGWGWSR